MVRGARSVMAAIGGAAATLILCLAACAGSPTGPAAAASDISEAADGELLESAAAAELFRLQILTPLDQQQDQQLEDSLAKPAARHRLHAAPASLSAAAASGGARRRKPVDGSAAAAREAALAADLADNAWAADDGALSDVPAAVHLRAEKGTQLPREKDTTVVFTLKQSDRELRATSAHLSFHLADSALPWTSGGSRETGRRETRRPTIKVEVVHWEDGGGAYKTEPIDGSLQRLREGRYSFDVEADRVRAALERTGRLELLVRCTNCRHPAPLGQRLEAGAGGAAPVFIADAELVLVGKKPRRLTPADDQWAPGGGRGASAAAAACDSQCCLRKLVVDFDQLGDAYSWIVAPRQFHANYCAGSCSGSLPGGGFGQRNRTAQAIVVDLMLQRQGKALGSCCVASSKKPVHLVYKDHDGQFRTDLGQLYTTTACACS